MAHPIDLSAESVEARLREVARLLAVRGVIDKSVDMSAAAVSARLKSCGALSDLCLRLGQWGRTLPPDRG